MCSPLSGLGWGEDNPAFGYGLSYAAGSLGSIAGAQIGGATGAALGAMIFSSVGNALDTSPRPQKQVKLTYASGATEIVAVADLPEGLAEAYGFSIAADGSLQSIRGPDAVPAGLPEGPGAEWTSIDGLLVPALTPWTSGQIVGYPLDPSLAPEDQIFIGPDTAAALAHAVNVIAKGAELTNDADTRWLRDQIAAWDAVHKVAGDGAGGGAPVGMPMRGGGIAYWVDDPTVVTPGDDGTLTTGVIVGYEMPTDYIGPKPPPAPPPLATQLQAMYAGPTSPTEDLRIGDVVPDLMLTRLIELYGNQAGDGGKAPDGSPGGGLPGSGGGDGLAPGAEGAPSRTGEPEGVLEGVLQGLSEIGTGWARNVTSVTNLITTPLMLSPLTLPLAMGVKGAVNAYDLMQAIDAAGGGLDATLVAVNERYNPAYRAMAAGEDVYDAATRGDDKEAGRQAVRFAVATVETAAMVVGGIKAGGAAAAGASAEASAAAGTVAGTTARRGFPKASVASEAAIDKVLEAMDKAGVGGRRAVGVTVESNGRVTVAISGKAHKVATIYERIKPHLPNNYEFAKPPEVKLAPVDIGEGKTYPGGEFCVEPKLSPALQRGADSMSVRWRGDPATNRWPAAPGSPDMRPCTSCAANEDVIVNGPPAGQ